MIKKQLILGLGTLIFSGLALFASAPSVSALADMCTWIGTNGSNFSNASNWAGCDNGNVPENGDAIWFDNTGRTVQIVANNDLNGAVFNTIRLYGNTSQRLLITGNSMTTSYIDNLNTGGGTLEIWNPLVLTNNNSTIVRGTPVVLDGVISGTGSLSLEALSSKLTLSGTNTYTGVTYVSSNGQLIVTNPLGLGSAAGKTTVAQGATLKFDITGDGVNIAEPLELSPRSVIGGDRALEVKRGTGTPSTITLSGAILLLPNTEIGSDYGVRIGSDRPLVLSGVISGVGQGFEFFDTSSDNSGSLQLRAANTYSGTTLTNDILSISGNQSANPVTVKSGGTLNGTGMVGILSVLSGGHLAPGNSPGCISSGNLSFVSGSNYDVEIGGIAACTGYDQTDVTGTVTLGDATLNTTLYGGFTPASGNSFTIISNDGSDAVSGTFAGLAEGATFIVDGVVLKISYMGGDGNDVVLTVQSVPGAPNTGFGLLTANPLFTLVLTTALAGTTFYLSRRLQTVRSAK